MQYMNSSIMADYTSLRYECNPNKIWQCFFCGIFWELSTWIWGKWKQKSDIIHSLLSLQEDLMS